MGKCRICGKPTLGDYQYCMQCNNSRAANKRLQGNTMPRQNSQVSVACKLGADYLKDGYYNDQGYLRKEIFTTEAEMVAGVLAASGMTSASLRRFYNKLRGIYARYQDNKNFDEIKPYLYKFYPNATDAVRRKIVPEEFRRFININVALAEQSPENLKGFVEHFQSVVAYFKDNEGRRN
ncbi:CRISPR-associated protein TM1810 domain protein [Desulfotomaculum nigrificans CO-1-SRB]|uniref:CRISPR system Cms protein Csm2 n=1 Tax=Desulfotomaculum nigrificans (strain DSM 14880 / VKM B-2319 / CO-1-SRB) TaxID=868595 RepID=F6B7U1_DESCC|nr:type III-A CRISPR-associated protein Csm2 [Desulfotomaculum nigrificans]AEF93463.1 CRISPR-associated protein TM1810 domain protein [Desulfotomaculum nigrificans CO-1-SRB]